MPDLRNMSAVQRVAAGFTAVVVLTLILWLTGAVDSAVSLTAYATLVLAIGTIGLAWGAIGTYTEQRRQLAAQQQQLEVARENDIAQVTIKRLTGPGEYFKVSVTNGASRAIRFVYIWIDVRGMHPHYEGVLLDTDPISGAPTMSRRMKTRRIKFDGYDLYRCHRTMLPGGSETFVQDARLVDSEVPDVDNSWITAYALFSDLRGAWWKCSEDGEVEQLPEVPALVVEHRPRLGTEIIPGMRPVPDFGRQQIVPQEQQPESHDPA